MNKAQTPKHFQHNEYRTFFTHMGLLSLYDFSENRTGGLGGLSQKNFEFQDALEWILDMQNTILHSQAFPS